MEGFFNGNPHKLDDLITSSHYKKKKKKGPWIVRSMKIISIKIVAVTTSIIVEVVVETSSNYFSGL